MIKTNTAEEIHHQISAKLSKGASYIDALVEYATENDLEVESVAEIVRKSPIIKEKVRAEAKKMRLVKQDKNASKLCE